MAPPVLKRNRLCGRNRVCRLTPVGLTWRAVTRSHGPYPRPVAPQTGACPARGKRAGPTAEAGGGAGRGRGLLPANLTHAWSPAMHAPIRPWIQHYVSVAVALILAAAAAYPAGPPKRSAESLDRGVVAVRTEQGVYVSWRLLSTDRPEVGFHVYRKHGDQPATRLTANPIRTTTDFLDTEADPCPECRWYVVPVLGQRQLTASVPVSALAKPYRAIRHRGNYTFQKVALADLDGNGRLDFVIKQPDANVDPYVHYWKPSPGTYKLEAYLDNGRFLWQYDLGWAIEQGIWYSPYVAFDFDGDGQAEIAVKTGEGDPRDADGRVQSGPEYLTILDGMTGKVRVRIDWPDRKPFYEIHGDRGYNYASRNQLGVAYLDGKRPHLIVERGTYGYIVVIAYRFDGTSLKQVWRWENRSLPRNCWGQGAHWMHGADVDGDGRDEVVIGSLVIDDSGETLWTTGLGHPDHVYVGDIDPLRPGLEIYYGMETRQRNGNGMCLVDAATGRILWGYKGPTRHVHGRGMCADIHPDYPGSECYSADTDPRKRLAWARLWSAQGEVIGREPLGGFGPLTVYWDGDAQRELLIDRQIRKYLGSTLARIQGKVVAVADVTGDWREELIVSVPGELRIVTTTMPSRFRHVTLLQDPIYRLDVAHASMGYHQVPMLSVDLATTIGGAGGAR